MREGYSGPREKQSERLLEGKEGIRSFGSFIRRFLFFSGGHRMLARALVVDDDSKLGQELLDYFRPEVVELWRKQNPNVPPPPALFASDKVAVRKEIEQVDSLLARSGINTSDMRRAIELAQGESEEPGARHK